MKKYIILLLFILLNHPFFSENTSELKGSWYPWNPYQSLDENKQLTGLDYELITTIFKASGINVAYDPSDTDSWKKNQNDVLSGEKDFAAGAFLTEYRKTNYFVSDPYRYEWNTIYVGRKDEELKQINNLNSFLAYIEKFNIKIGVIQGYTYTSDQINQFIENQKALEKNCLVEANTEEANFKNFIDGKARVIISDRLVGARILWDKKWGTAITEHNIELPGKPIHLLLHKGSDSITNVLYKSHLLKFNNSLKKLKANGTCDAIINNHLFPVLMNITVQTNWFHIIDLIGIIFFAFTGLLVAFDNKFDLFGTLLITLLFCSGGGIIRDLLVGRPLSLIEHPIVIQLILSISFIGFLVFKLHGWLLNVNFFYKTKVIQHEKKLTFIRIIIEATALGAYTIIGVGVAVEMRLDHLEIWGPILGCTTACAGGILANFLTKKDSSNALNGSLDPEFSIVWGIFFSQFLIWQTNRLNPNEVFIAVLFTMAGSMSILAFTHIKKWKSPKINN